jgi:thiol-disulfide isomerase/thioredoxin
MPEATKEEPKLILRKFGALWCGPCKAMARAKTLEKFEGLHANVEVKVYDVDDEAAEKLSDELDVQAVPAFIFEDLEGNIVARDDGATNLAGLEKLYKLALDNLASGKFGKVARKRKKRA